MIIVDDELEIEVCDHCHVEFQKDKNGRLFAGFVNDTGYNFGIYKRPKYAVKCLFGVLLCEDCDKAIERKKVRKVDPTHPKMKAYLKRVERGKGITKAKLKRCGMER